MQANDPGRAAIGEARKISRAIGSWIMLRMAKGYRSCFRRARGDQSQLQGLAKWARSVHLDRDIHNFGVHSRAARACPALSCINTGKSARGLRCVAGP